MCLPLWVYWLILKNKDLRYYIFDRNKEKYIFPERQFLVEYMCMSLKERMTKAEIKKYLIGLNKEVGLFITAIDYDGGIREDEPFDFYENICERMRKEGRLIGEGKL